MSSKKWNDPQLDAAQFAIDRFLIAQQTVSEQMAEIYQSTRDGCATDEDMNGVSRVAATTRRSDKAAGTERASSRCRCADGFPPTGHVGEASMSAKDVRFSVEARAKMLRRITILTPA